MIRILVLADDLTGAADCAVAFAGCGLRAIVALDDGRDCDAEVLAIDANTRASEPHEAAAAMERLIRAHARGDDLLIYKKIDSTLRGNVAAELKAVLAAHKSHMGEGIHNIAVLAPAFPATGRTTLGGRQLVNGTPLSETDLWQQERKSPPENLIEMMDESGLRSDLLELSAIRGNNLREIMTKLAREADVLEHLLRRKGNVVSKKFLEDQIFGLTGEFGSNAVEVYVHRLRKRLADIGANVQVHTVRGVGYMLAEAK